MRKWKETVKDWPQIKERCLYRVQVIKIKKIKKTMSVSFEFLERPMSGKIITVDFDLPIHPGGKTCDYFHACGQHVSIGAEIEPRATIDCEIYASFKKTDKKYQIDSIKPIRKEVDHGGYERNLKKQ